MMQWPAFEFVVVPLVAGDDANCSEFYMVTCGANNLAVTQLPNSRRVQMIEIIANVFRQSVVARIAHDGLIVVIVQMRGHNNLPSCKVGVHYPMALGERFE